MSDAIDKLYEELEDSIDTYGINSEEVAIALNRLAYEYMNQGDVIESLKYNNKSYEILDELEIYDEKITIVVEHMYNAYSLMTNYDEALKCAMYVYEMRCEIFGKHHRQTIMALLNLSGLYLEKKDMEEGVKLSNKTYLLALNNLGKEDIVTIKALQNYAISIYSNGDYKKSLELSKGGYELFCSYYNGVGVNAMDCQHISALSYKGLGDYETALDLGLECLDFYREHLGNSHRSTLNSMNTLAGLYSELGQYAESLAIIEECYELEKTSYGEDAFNTLRVMGTYALALKDNGNIKKSIEVNKKQYELLKSLYGEENLSTMSSVTNLAVRYMEFGNFELSIELSSKSYNLKNQLLGKNHPSTLLSMSNLAEAYRAGGYLEKSKKITKECLELKRKVFGENHKETATSLSNLGNVSLQHGEVEEARVYKESALRIKENLLGINNIETLQLYCDLSSIYRELGDLDNAREYIQVCIDSGSKLLGNSHQRVLDWISNKAVIDHSCNNQIVDIDSIRHNIELKIKKYGELTPAVVQDQSNLTCFLVEEEKYEEAIAYGESILPDCYSLLGEKHEYTLNAILNIGTAYMRLGKLELAEKNFLKVYDLTKDDINNKKANMLATHNLAIIHGHCYEHEEPKALYYIDKYLKETICYLQDNFTNLFNDSAKYNFIHETILRFKFYLVIYSSLSDKYAKTAYKYALLFKTLLLDVDYYAKEISYDSKININQLNNQIQDLNNKAENGIGSQRELKTEIFKLKQQRYEISKNIPFSETLQKDYLTNIQSCLCRKQILLDFNYCYDNELVLFIITSNKISLVKCDANIVPLIDQYIKNTNIITNSIKFKNEADDIELIKKENIAILNRIKKHMQILLNSINDKTHIIICSDDFLFKFPFVELFEGKEITYLSSAKDLLRIEKNFDSLDASLVGSPVFPNKLAPHRGSDEPRDNRYKQLPFSILEVERISQMIHQNKFEYKQHTGIQVDKSSIIGEDEYSILHISTHGTYENRSDSNVVSIDDIIDIKPSISQNPMTNSKIILSNDKNALDNIHLDALEISLHDYTSTNMVVLSLCQSALGDSVYGGGLYGFNRAFKLAGVETVISSLWKVNDFSAYVFMVKFYELLCKGYTKLQAYNQTKTYMKNLTIKQCIHDFNITQDGFKFHSNLLQKNNYSMLQRTFLKEFYMGLVKKEKDNPDQKMFSRYDYNSFIINGSWN